MKKALPLLVIVAFGACTGDHTDQPGAAVRDSAGIRIVENTTPLWQQGQAWHLSTEPVVDIGAQSDPLYELFRVNGAVRLATGEIVIANAGSSELRFYDATGSYLRASGGEGEGPGEFLLLRSLYRLGGDSLLVRDPLAGRLSLFDAEGAFVRVIRLTPTDGAPMPTLSGVFDDGSFLVHGMTLEAAEIGFVRPDAVLFRYATDGTVLHRLGVFPGNETYIFVDAQGNRGMNRAHFQRGTGFLVTRNRFVVASNDSYELVLYDMDGDLEMLVRKSQPVVSIGDAEVRALREYYLSQTAEADARRRLLQWFDAMPVAPSMPAYATVWGDALGNLWVADYDPLVVRAPRWSVFNAEGVWLGVVTTPEGFRPLDIGSDYVLGLWRDADDVEHVRLYTLIKPDG